MQTWEQLLGSALCRAPWGSAAHVHVLLLAIPLLIRPPLRLTPPTPKSESRGQPLAPHGLQLQEIAWAVGVRQRVC